MNKLKLKTTALLLLISSSAMLFGCSTKTSYGDKLNYNGAKEVSTDINLYEVSSNAKKELAKAQNFKEERSESQDETVTPSEDPNRAKIDFTTLSNEKQAWWFKPNKTHATPEINLKLNYSLSDYDAHYVGDTSKPILYLTFDEGYENGYTAKILDILKENDVKAIFFVTLPYLKDNPDLIKRMVEEGHIVGNHTNHHPSMPDVTGNEEKFNHEFSDVEDKYREITGSDIPKYFRPPMGEYSQKSLAMTKNLGYKTVFWSFAYHDWDINKQPEPSAAKEKILGGLHNGSILLIHAVSKTNTEILDSVLKEATAQGYSFELLP